MRKTNVNKQQLEKELYECLVHELGHWFMHHLIPIQEKDRKLSVFFDYSSKRGTTDSPVLTIRTKGKIISKNYRTPKGNNNKIAYASGYAAQKMLGIKLGLDQSSHGDLKQFRNQKELEKWIEHSIPLLTPYKDFIQQGAKKLSLKLKNLKGGEYVFSDEEIKKTIGINKFPTLILPEFYE